MIAIALVLFALPFPTKEQIKRFQTIRANQATVAIVGPSTISYVSACDSDRRAIPAMLAADSGRTVLDLSYGGQPTIEAIDISAAVSRSGPVKDVVLPLVHSQIDDWTTPAYRTLLTYKMFTPGFRVFAAASAQDFWQGIRGAPRRLVGAYRFEGHEVPDYSTLSTTVFAGEKQHAGCPEPTTHDVNFTRGYFWWTHLATRENPALYDFIADLQTNLASRGKTLHVVVLPSNIELLDTLHPGWGAAVATKQHILVANLRGRGVRTLDLSTAFTNAEFSTRWCACAHLNETGRHHLSRMIAADLARKPEEQAPTIAMPRAATTVGRG